MTCVNDAIVTDDIEPERSLHPLASAPQHIRRAHEVLSLGAAAILPERGLAESLLLAEREKRPLRVKLGIDPSGSQLTLGHSVVLRKLRQFQDFGHKAVLVVGGFTGQVGDPTGRTATRSARSAQEVVDNARGYFDQVLQILDSDPQRLEIVDNNDWLGSMQLGDILAYTREITVAQLLERDDFAKRFASRAPITLSEFFYPLLQGIDSVEIHADIELGGTDQTFNNLVGRELQKARGQRPQIVLTVPLLVGTDGVEKMGKSLGNFVAITEPPAEQFGKLMSIPDGVVESYAVLCTGLPPEQIAVVAAAIAAGGPAANQAKRRVAREIVALYHGSDASADAEARFDAVFRDRETPTDVPEVGAGAGDPVHLPTLMIAMGAAASSSAARRLLDSGAVKVSGKQVKALDLSRAALIGNVLSVGKRHHARITD
jgi:tyrosyl-tRNA synthetase